MTVPSQQLRDAVRRLHGYLLDNHWNGRAIVGPDSGVRVEFRIGRFVKSYLDFLAWPDRYAFMQAQGYWILGNWLMADLLGDERCRDLALNCSDFVIAAQRSEGYWEYPPVPSRKGKIATVEGHFAALGLLESYRRMAQEPFLTCARKWHRFLLEDIGFQERDGVLAVNYWANASAGMVPNNTTLTLRTLAQFADVTNDDHYLAPCEAMVAFLRSVQLASGELPYMADTATAAGRSHFLCFQYNAFEFLDLADYYLITADEAIHPVLERLALFLSHGIAGSGAARHDCRRARPEVPYYTAAMAAALNQAAALGLGDFRPLADRAYRWVLAQQLTDGGMAFFSRGNYGLLTDRRSYPRHLAMILYHLLLALWSRADPARNNLAGLASAHKASP